jgi:RsiW-degrading membrane proteinase PrsW (M82 family)
MTGKNAKENAFLRLVSGNNPTSELESQYSLFPDREVVIGRDPSCDVVLDALAYRMVSRRHAAVRPVSSFPEAGNSWLICDLNSANGTYLNGQRLEGCQQLMAGDRISLGHDGPEMIFEYNLSQPTPAISQAGATALPSATDYQTPTFASLQPPPNSDSLSFTQLFPILSTGKDLTRKAYLIPGIFTVVFVVLMFVTLGRAELNQLNQSIVAIYISSIAYYFIYQLCGKKKPWWVLLLSLFTTVVILRSPVLNLFSFVFRDILADNVVGTNPLENSQITFKQFLIWMFFGAGLMEELLKALPVVGAYFIGKSVPSPWSERIGIREPLDGILLGTASAVGFTLYETLGQYLPEFTRSVALQFGPEASELASFAALQLLIPRILGSVSGHMAYSGYLGYFIGLAILKPRKSWQILLVGYITASGLHALWNAAGGLNPLLLAVVGVLSYAFLMAAILKARALSPTRSENFATRFFGPK